MSACSIEGCGRSSLKKDHGSRGMCSMHYARWRKHSPDRPRCASDGCDKPATGRGMCHKHYAAFWRTSTREGTFAPADSRDRWADGVAYRTAHQRVAALRGPAAGHKCIQCGDPARQWAYQHNDPNQLRHANGYPYSLLPECYEPMCYPCHAVLDGRKTVTNCPNGHPWAEFARHRRTTGERWCLGCSRDREDRKRKART